MNKEFLKMQKLAGLITENQFKKKINENEQKSYDDLLKIVSQYESDSEDYVGSFKERFQGQNMITKDEWMDWSRTIDGGYDPENFSEENWELA